jgi:hypothetical protein
MSCTFACHDAIRQSWNTGYVEIAGKLALKNLVLRQKGRNTANCSYNNTNGVEGAMRRVAYCGA